MVDVLFEVMRWLLVAFFGGQLLIFAGLIVWSIWTDAIRPQLIPAKDIDRIAADFISQYPDPEREAFARRERAWYRSESAEQTYWHRVEKAVRRRLEA